MEPFTNKMTIMVLYPFPGDLELYVQKNTNNKYFSSTVILNLDSFSLIKEKNI